MKTSGKSYFFIFCQAVGAYHCTPLAHRDAYIRRVQQVLAAANARRGKCAWMAG